MKDPWLLAVGLVSVGLAVQSSAWAQRPPGLVPTLAPTQRPPLQEQSQQSGVAIPPSRIFPGAPGPTAQRTTLPDGQGSQDAPQTGTPPSVTPPSATTIRPDAWLSAKVARLQALDKVNAQTTVLTIRVGQSATFGSLTIEVKSCVVRPPDRPADAAAFLAVTDAHADTPSFDGWMLVTEPALSMMQHPVYDLRVVGCA